MGTHNVHPLPFCIKFLKKAQSNVADMGVTDIYITKAYLVCTKHLFVLVFVFIASVKHYIGSSLGGLQNLNKALVWAVLSKI